MSMWQSPEPCECYLTCEREIKIADGTEVVNHPISKYRGYPGLSRWTQCNHKGP